MLLRPIGLAAILCLALVPALRAGDTVTDNLPGGAAQVPGAGAMTAQINAAPPALAPPMIAPGGQPPPTASGAPPGPAPAPGAAPAAFTMNSAGGRSFSTASPFIGRVLNFYAGP